MADPAGRYALTFRPAALRALRKLDRQIAERIEPATEALRDNPRPSGAKMLTGSRGLWRIRIGDYRVVYTIADPKIFAVCEMVCGGLQQQAAEVSKLLHPRHEVSR